MEPARCLASAGLWRAAAVAIPIIAMAHSAAAELLTGRAKVIDGDTLRVAGIAVRLQGVAAPEVRHRGQPADEPGGQAAAAFMRQLVEGRVLACELSRERSWGRRVGICRLAGRDVGAELIAAGLARDCPRYSGGRYAGMERPEAARLPFPCYCRPRRR